MKNTTQTFPEIDLINKHVFKVCGTEITNLETESESQEYFAHNLQLNNKKVKFRMAKITPTKTGQFVTIWKRNINGITEPHNIDDKFEFYIIATKEDSKFGVFIFNQAILSENKILSNQKTEGKRGIRVYQTWSVTTNKQAIKTQIWQTKYFIEIPSDNQIDIKKAKQLLGLR